MELPRTTVGLGPIFVIVSAVAVNNLVFLLIQVQQDVEFVQTDRFLFRLVLRGNGAFAQNTRIVCRSIDNVMKICYKITVRLTPTSPVPVC